MYGAYRASQSNKAKPISEAPPSIAKTLSNGTHTFAPTTILISLDGFRADFLNRGLTPTLNSFIRNGVSPKHMLPSFPSLTFPNHFTLVTGLYPESHGVVGNTFWDPNIQKEFYYTDPNRSMQPEWWNAEPLWETAELAGVRTAIHMWPGSEAHIGSMEPAYVDKFNADEHLDLKVQRVLYWLDLPGPDDVAAQSDEPRPQLIATYVPNVDADGHLYGPNSTYIRSTIAEVDGMLGNLFEAVDERNLTDVVNIVVVSDHGMATTSTHRLIQLEDLIDTDLIERIDGWPLYGLRPYDQSEAQLEKLYNQLMARSSLPEYEGKIAIYTKETMPERYHFTANDRIAPLWIMPSAGWAIVTKDEFDVQQALEQDLIYHPRGLHGYDHEDPLMRAIFVARGPAFPHPKGSQIDVFQNTEVYNIVCDSLGIMPVPNNGTLRLPFEPLGVHDFDTPLEEPEDPQDPEPPTQPDPPVVPNLAYPQSSVAPTPAETEAPPEVSNLAYQPDLVFPTQAAPSNMPKPQHHPFEHSDDSADAEAETEDDAASAERPVVHDGLADDEKPGDINRWWEWVSGKLDAVRGWAVDAFGGHKEKPDGDNAG